MELEEIEEESDWVCKDCGVNSVEKLGDFVCPDCGWILKHY